jgi:DEAD/DEAH box helicase domain-containing protein
MKNEVIFDVETKKLFGDDERFDPATMGVSISSLYIRKVDDNQNEIEGQMVSFWEKDFDKMWPFFQKADRIIGFNSIGFDVPALSPYTNFPFKKLPHFDIMYKFKEIAGHRISLDSLAKTMLGKEKIDEGVNAVYYFQQGDAESLAKLKKYCEMDVAITRDIYDFAVKNKKLLYKDKWNTPREINVDFSYPKEEIIQNQIGLF